MRPHPTSKQSGDGTFPTEAALTVDQYVIRSTRPDGTRLRPIDKPAGGRRCVQQRASLGQLPRVRVTLLPVDTQTRRQLLATGHGEAVRTAAGPAQPALEDAARRDQRRDTAAQAPRFH